ncbi:MAG: hypothetical protein ACQEP5_04985 [Actinomycetota bacterium]
MNLNLEKNSQQVSQLAEKFLTVAEDIKAVYEHSARKKEGDQTRVYILTNLKIIYVELSGDAFIKCYPLNKDITYQIERERSDLSGKNIIKAKIHISPDASIIFRFDQERDQSNYFTTLAGEKKAAYNFIIQLNSLLAEI